MIYSGEVKEHKGRGRKLGFPTANIAVPEDAPDGVYVGLAELKDTKYPCLFFIGAAVTFDETEKHGEVYILDFEGDLYGMEIFVEVLDKLRDNKKFDDPEDLVRQMADDVKNARDYFDQMDK